jgi:hypothetical protein
MAAPVSKEAVRRGRLITYRACFLCDAVILRLG